MQELKLIEDHDDQVEIYYADRHNMSKTLSGFKPRWIKVPQPHTACQNSDKARLTIDALKKTNLDFTDKIFRIVRIRDNQETYNEWTAD